MKEKDHPDPWRLCLRPPPQQVLPDSHSRADVGAEPLTQSQPPITRTTHTLPFDKLSGARLRLCLWLVERERYERAGHMLALPSTLPLLSDHGKIPWRVAP